MRLHPSSIRFAILAITLARPLICVVLMLFCLTCGSANADIITFEGVAPPGGQTFPVAPYFEGSFFLTATSPNNGIFSVTSPFNTAGFTSDFFAWGPPEITLAEIAGTAFNLKSLEIGDSGTSPGPSTDITLTGFFSKGGSISQNFFGVTSATLVSPIGFTNLTSLDISAANGDAGIDNISVNVIPEPTTAIIGLFGLVGLIGGRRRIHFSR